MEESKDFSQKRVEAISKEEVIASKVFTIPSEVFSEFNKEITRNWNGHSSTILQSDIAARIAKALKIQVSEVYRRNYLDVESTYRAKGWKVDYDTEPPITYKFS